MPSRVVAQECDFAFQIVLKCLLSYKIIGEGFVFIDFVIDTVELVVGVPLFI